MVRDAGGRRGAAAGGRRGRARGGRGGGDDHSGMGLAADGPPTAPVDGDVPPVEAGNKARKINQILYERSHERFTWNRALRPHPEPMKRTKVLPQARSREKNVTGSCVYHSIATALEAANRICGVEVDELAWEELFEMVREDNPNHISAALRVLKYRGIQRKVDYEKRESNGKRFKISQFYEFCNVDIIDDNVSCGLDQHNIKAAIDSMLSKSVMLAHFPISRDYLELLDGSEHIYAYDEDSAIYEQTSDGLRGRIYTHVVVVTGFGFEEEMPYFEFLDCNGKGFGKKGYGRILPSSIISLYGFDIVLD